jgi:hypothetical protein
MSRLLGWVATIGLGVGFVSLGIAYALGGRDLLHQFDRRGGFVLQSCEQSAENQGKVGERRLSWPGGDAIDIALPAIVHFRGSDDGDIVVRGAPSLIANVDIDGHRLRLNCRWATTNRDIEIDLPGKYRHVGILGSGQVTMDNLSQRRLELRIAGSGNVSAKGAVDHLHLKLAGSGNARMENLAVKDLRVEIAGSGNVDAAARDEADIRIAGSGDVRLYGKPIKVKSHIAGSGRISQVEAVDDKKP